MTYIVLGDVSLNKVELYQIAVDRLGICPIQLQDDFMCMRVVHDLGIAGDDFQDFFEILSNLKPTSGKVPREFIPGELSRDAYLVACARGWLARKWPALAKFHTARIGAPELRLHDLDRYLYPE